MRYITKYEYGRYIIVDTLVDREICFCYTSEYAELICKAMNALYNRDTNEERREA